MSTERSLAVERALAVVRFAFSQVVRKGWSKQNCTSYFILHGFRFALHHITASGEEDDQPNLLIYLIDPITDPNIVRTQITEGPNSIIKNLPLPDVQQLGRFSYIPIKDLVKLTFALGLPIRQYKENKDWLHNEKYEGKYFETLHQMLETLSTGTRIIILRCWSDGFQPFSVKDNNKKFNSLQIVTATLLGKE